MKNTRKIKVRRTWKINPATKIIESEKETYDRTEEKRAVEEEIEEALTNDTEEELQ